MKTSSRSGAALLVVLIIVMAITITSLGFLSQSDVELACGENMVVRTQMDYLAESGLEHAKGLILNPQDARTTGYEYWIGGTGLQLQSGKDYYEISIVRETDRCNYIIDCNSYRMKGSERIGFSSLSSELRLDPCIAYWTGSNTTVWPSMVINGDVYCGGTLTNNGAINGDAFATGSINGTGTTTGQKNATVTTAPVAWPVLVSTNFGPNLYYIGSTTYVTGIPSDPNALSGTFDYYGTNPAGIWYCATDANMPSGATINGTLVVGRNLIISGTNNIITARPNFPALIVNGQVEIKNGASLTINGLAQIGQTITVDPNTTNANITVTGALFINGGGIEGVTSNSVVFNVTAAPAITAIEVWPSSGTPYRWRSAAGAFFKSIRRNM